MSMPLILAALWVLGAALTAMLPMRWQYPPGIALLVAVPVLVWMIWAAHGGLVAGLGLAAAASMFRRPLAGLWARLTRRGPDGPDGPNGGQGG